MKKLKPLPETIVHRALFVMKSELKLLRALEAANRRADPKNCPKSLNEKSALQALSDFRETVMGR